MWDIIEQLKRKWVEAMDKYYWNKVVDPAEPTSTKPDEDKTAEPHEIIRWEGEGGAAPREED